MSDIVFHTRKGASATDSLKVAAKFNKLHKNVPQELPLQPLHRITLAEVLRLLHQPVGQVASLVSTELQMVVSTSLTEQVKLSTQINMHN